LRVLDFLDQLRQNRAEIILTTLSAFGLEGVFEDHERMCVKCDLSIQFFWEMSERVEVKGNGSVGIVLG
jgi:hypothetical protein